MLVGVMCKVYRSILPCLLLQLGALDIQQPKNIRKAPSISPLHLIKQSFGSCICYNQQFKQTIKNIN